MKLCQQTTKGLSPIARGNEWLSSAARDGCHPRMINAGVYHHIRQTVWRHLNYPWSCDTIAANEIDLNISGIYFDWFFVSHHTHTKLCTVYG